MLKKCVAYLTSSKGCSIKLYKITCTVHDNKHTIPVQDQSYPTLTFSCLSCRYFIKQITNGFRCTSKHLGNSDVA